MVLTPLSVLDIVVWYMKTSCIVYFNTQKYIHKIKIHTYKYTNTHTLNKKYTKIHDIILKHEIHDVI